MKILIIMAIWFIVSCAIFAVISVENDILLLRDVFHITPNLLHDYTKMNMFGCWFCSVIIYLLTSPYSIVVGIFYFFYWICHIKVKKDKN